MKTNEYIDKYKLNETIIFDNQSFVNDLNNDFKIELNKRKDKNNYVPITGFENAAKCIYEKWESINNKIPVKIEDKIWKYFWKVYVADLRDQLFPEEMKKRNEIKTEKNKYHYHKNSFYSQYKLFNEFFNFNFYQFVDDMLNNMLNNKENIKEKYQSYFTALSLNIDNSKIDDVKSKYRELSKLYHPDQGSTDYDNFILITEAKNKCLEYLNTI